jgi:hypothetical protein
MLDLPVERSREPALASSLMANAQRQLPINVSTPVTRIVFDDRT